MVVALLVLSLAMIVSGLLAMVLGWDIVLLERGWAMVIAGSVAASGGAILLGLVAVIARLTRIQSELATLRERNETPDLPLPPSPVIDPVSLLSSGLLAGVASKEGEADDKREEPKSPAFAFPGDGEPESERSERSGGSSSEDEDERFAPAIPREERFGEASSEPDRSPGEPEDLFADQDETPADDEEDDLPESARPAWARGLEAEPPKPDWARDRAEPAPAKPEPAPESAATAPDPAPRSPVIGTYNSGGNRYVMFADGSIEAETPEGVFKFASLDELKEFIASGGESGGPT